MSLFYLSFVDVEAPVGPRHLGATIVNANSAPQAWMEAKRLGLFPEGMVETAIIELWTQEEPQELIEKPEQLPPEAVILYEKFVNSKDLAHPDNRPIDNRDPAHYICAGH